MCFQGGNYEQKIFIDPGHGGIDSGAVGINNLLEKNINLSVAKKLNHY
ncbi:N-acetylmuramoyl-L-alanine amidase [Paraclostridium benzoelyticum]